MRRLLLICASVVWLSTGANAQKFSDYVAGLPLDTPASQDRLPMVRDPGGTPFATRIADFLGAAMAQSGLPFASLRQSAQLNPTPGQFYVDAAGLDTADCLAATVTGGHGPCLTIARALVKALASDARQNSVTINIGVGTFSENVAVNGTSSGTVNNTNFIQNKLSTPMVTLKGAGSGSTTISGGQTISGQPYCYAIFANNGAMLSLQGMTVIATATPAGCNQSALFVQTNAIIFIDDDVRLGPANQDLISAEEHGGVYVTAGCGAACTGLTLAGNTTAGNGINISADSWFSSDSTVNISGALTFGGGFLFLADTNSLIKCSGNPCVTSGATITGSRFYIGAGSTMTVANVPISWPGTIGGVDFGGRYQAADNIPCLGGAAGCSAVFAPTNIGGSGTGGMSASSGMYGGAVQLSPLTGGGPGPGNTGLVYIGWTTLFPVGAICTAQLVDGTGTWDARATIKGGGFSTANDVHWQWDNNGVALISGSTYYIGYSCNTSK